MIKISTQFQRPKIILLLITFFFISILLLNSKIFLSEPASKRNNVKTSENDIPISNYKTYDSDSLSIIKSDSNLATIDTLKKKGVIIQ